MCDPAERARKAVAGRIRDAIRTSELVHAALAAHLDRTIRTGTYRSYQPGATTTAWAVHADPA